MRPDKYPEDSYEAEKPSETLLIIEDIRNVLSSIRGKLQPILKGVEMPKQTSPSASTHLQQELLIVLEMARDLKQDISL